MDKLKKLYDPTIIVLALISIIFVVLDFANIINISQEPYLGIDRFILIIFATDYFTRLYLAKNKWQFFKENIFDLIAIIPFDAVFSFFRIARVFRIARLARLARLVGFVGKLQRNSKKFLHTNGFIYLIYVSIFLLLFASILYSIAENVPLKDAFWWAMATATTVGYGDISPTTSLGKFAAIILMFLGIGVIGMLTSTITSYFTEENKVDENKELHEKIDYLIKRIDDLEHKIDDKS